MPYPLNVVVQSGWKFASARPQLPPVQLQRQERREIQNWVEYVFSDGGLRIFVSPPLADNVFAVLMDTRLPAYAAAARLSTTPHLLVTQKNSYTLVLPIRPIASKAFDRLKSRRWSKDELLRQLGPPSFNWHVHGVGWEGMTYVAEGLSFVGDPRLGVSFQLGTGSAAEKAPDADNPSMLPALKSVARTNYPAMQQGTRKECTDQLLQQKIDLDEAIAKGERSPDGRFTLGIINFEERPYTNDFVVKEGTQPERLFPAGEVDDGFWLDAATYVFTANTPDGVAFQALDPVSGAITKLAEETHCQHLGGGCIAARGVTDQHEFWYKTEDGTTHQVRVDR